MQLWPVAQRTAIHCITFIVQCLCMVHCQFGGQREIECDGCDDLLLLSSAIIRMGCQKQCNGTTAIKDRAISLLLLQFFVSFSWRGRATHAPGLRKLNSAFASSDFVLLSSTASQFVDGNVNSFERIFYELISCEAHCDDDRARAQYWNVAYIVRQYVVHHPSE